VFLVSIERYLEPLIPLLALTAGYGLCAVVSTYQRHKLFVVLVAVVLCAYNGAVYGRYAELAYRNDTKLEARSWALANLPAGSEVIVDSQPVRFAGTPEGIGLMQKLDPSALRNADQALLRNPSGADTFNTYNLYLVGSSTAQKVISGILALNNPDTYILTDSWSNTPALQPYLARAALIKSFSNGATILVPQGLFIGGEQHSEVGAHVLQLLWRADYFGADMSIYRVKTGSSTASTAQ